MKVTGVKHLLTKVWTKHRVFGLTKKVVSIKIKLNLDMTHLHVHICDNLDFQTIHTQDYSYQKQEKQEKKETEEFINVVNYHPAYLRWMVVCKWT